MVILFSAVEDKEYESMIRELCERVPAETYVVTEIEDGRRSAGRGAETYI